MQDVLTGVYAERRFVAVDQGGSAEETLRTALLCLQEYFDGLLGQRSLPLRNDVRRGIYTRAGEALSGTGRNIVLAVVERELRQILLCGFGRGDSGVIGYRLDIEELHRLIPRFLSENPDHRHDLPERVKQMLGPDPEEPR